VTLPRPFALRAAARVVQERLIFWLTVWRSGSPTVTLPPAWKAAYDRDYGWLGEVITKHYHGDDSVVKVLIGGVLQAFAGMDVQDYQAAAHRFLHQGRRPTLDRASTRSSN
jgi:hypothetical protein